MVLVVIAEETQPVVTKYDPRVEQCLVPIGHRVELPGAQHEVGKFGRADRLSNGRELARGADVVHRLFSLFNPRNPAPCGPRSASVRRNGADSSACCRSSARLAGTAPACG